MGEIYLVIFCVLAIPGVIGYAIGHTIGRRGRPVPPAPTVLAPISRQQPERTAPPPIDENLILLRALTQAPFTEQLSEDQIRSLRDALRRRHQEAHQIAENVDQVSPTWNRRPEDRFKTEEPTPATTAAATVAEPSPAQPTVTEPSRPEEGIAATGRVPQESATPEPGQVPAYVSQIAEPAIAVSAPTPISPTEPPPPPRRPVSERLDDLRPAWDPAVMMLYLGALLVVAAGLIYASYNWATIGPWQKMGMLIAATAAFIIAGFATRRFQRVRAASDTFIMIGAMLVPANAIAAWSVFNEAQAHPELSLFLGALATTIIHGLFSIQPGGKIFNYSTVVAAGLAIATLPGAVGFDIGWGAPLLLLTIAALGPNVPKLSHLNEAWRMSTRLGVPLAITFGILRSRVDTEWIGPATLLAGALTALRLAALLPRWRTFYHLAYLALLTSGAFWAADLTPGGDWPLTIGLIALTLGLSSLRSHYQRLQPAFDSVIAIGLAVTAGAAVAEARDLVDAWPIAAAALMGTVAFLWLATRYDDHADVLDSVATGSAMITAFAIVHGALNERPNLSLAAALLVGAAMVMRHARLYARNRLAEYDAGAISMVAIATFSLTSEYATERPGLAFAAAFFVGAALMFAHARVYGASAASTDGVSGLLATAGTFALASAYIQPAYAFATTLMVAAGLMWLYTRVYPHQRDSREAVALSLITAGTYIAVREGATDAWALLAVGIIASLAAIAYGWAWSKWRDTAWTLASLTTVMSAIIATDLADGPWPLTFAPLALIAATLANRSDGRFSPQFSSILRVESLGLNIGGLLAAYGTHDRSWFVALAALAALLTFWHLLHCRQREWLIPLAFGVSLAWLSPSGMLFDTSAWSHPRLFVWIVALTVVLALIALQMGRSHLANDAQRTVTLPLWFAAGLATLWIVTDGMSSLVRMPAPLEPEVVIAGLLTVGIVARLAAWSMREPLARGISAGLTLLAILVAAETIPSHQVYKPLFALVMIGAAIALARYDRSRPAHPVPTWDARVYLAAAAFTVLITAGMALTELLRAAAGESLPVSGLSLAWTLYGALFLIAGLVAIWQGHHIAKPNTSVPSGVLSAALGALLLTHLITNDLIIWGWVLGGLALALALTPHWLDLDSGSVGILLRMSALVAFVAAVIVIAVSMMSDRTHHHLANGVIFLAAGCVCLWLANAPSRRSLFASGWMSLGIGGTFIAAATAMPPHTAAIWLMIAAWVTLSFGLLFARSGQRMWQRNDWMIAAVVWNLAAAGLALIAMAGDQATLGLVILTLLSLSGIVATCGAVLRERKIILAATVIAIAALQLQIRDGNPTNVHAYTLPLAIYLLVVGWLMRGQPRVANALLAAGSGMLLIPALLLAFQESSVGWLMVALIEALALFVVGSFLRLRVPTAAAILGVTAIIPRMLIDVVNALESWVALLTAGIFLLALGTIWLIFREAIRDRLRRWWSVWSTWS